MIWIAGVVGAGGAATTLRRRIVRGNRAQSAADEMVGVREMADEDVTLLGEQLARVGAHSPADVMDEATRNDYQAALDAYESAKRAVPRLTRPEEVGTVVDTLSAGRYALACVQARLEGRPVPDLRVPCFFNPQHGPSVQDVLWTVPGRGTRTVPACAQDASRVAHGEHPEIRKVRYGSRVLPYWDAGAAVLPYGKNYYSSAVLQVGYQHTVERTGGGIGGL
ncbi:MAG: hypothetical protein ACJ72A_02345 [Nocardioidaceae bacterium]